MVFTVFLPARTASAITIVVALGMWLSAGDLFDVAWPIIGTALAGRILSGAATHPAAITRRRPCSRKRHRQPGAPPRFAARRSRAWAATSAASGPLLGGHSSRPRATPRA